MKYGRLNVIASIAFLSIQVILMSYSPVCFAYQATGDSEADQIIDLLKTTRILTFDERNNLSQLVNRLADTEKKPSVLRDLALMIDQRIEDNKKELQYLMANLELLRNSDYARTIGEIKKSDLEDCWRLYDKLEYNIGKVRPRDYRYRKQIFAEDYLNIIKNNIVFLIDEENSVTLSDLWESIKKMVKPVYLSWNRKYVDLKKVRRKYYGGYKMTRTNRRRLLHPESSFVQTFGKVQVVLRKLSEPNSPDF